jgi:hypothetical protein
VEVQRTIISTFKLQKKISMTELIMATVQQQQQQQITDRNNRRNNVIEIAPFHQLTI